MKRLILGLSALVLAAFAGVVSGGGQAQASWDWCWDDPLVLVQGRILDIQSGVPLSHIRDLDGPVDVKVYVPSNVSAAVILNPGIPYRQNVTVVKSGAAWHSGDIPVRVEITVHSDEDFDTSMLVTHQGGFLRIVDVARIYGRSNATMSGDFRLTPLLGLLP